MVSNIKQVTPTTLREWRSGEGSEDNKEVIK